MKTKTKRLSFLLAVFALIGIFTLGAFAAEEKTSGDFTYVVENEAAVITAYSGDATDVIIPATLGGYPVKEIGQHVFYYCTQIESLTLPEGIEKIGDYAFGGLGGLKKLKIPDSVKIIGEGAFSEIGITELTVPETVELLGDSAFSGCSKLKKAVLLNKMEKLPNSIFAGCGQLTEVNIPDTVNEIGESAFANCSELPAINLPSGLTVIGKSAFSSCEALGNITLPEGLTKIGDSAFFHTSFKEITVPASVESLGRYVFDMCDNLETATIFAKIEKIEDGVFSDCNNLKNVKLPDTVKEIGEYAFSYCKELKKINLPAELKTIGFCAFEDCDSLTRIVLPSKVTSISERAFYQCGGLEAVDTGNTAKIGVEAFASCRKLEQVIFGSKLKTINKNAFTLPFDENGRIHFCYRGTKAQWKEITIKNCDSVKKEPIHCGYTESHVLEKILKKASLSADGSIYEKCTACDFKRVVDIIEKPDYFTLSENRYIYNKKVKTPSVTVYDAEGVKLKKDKDYTVKYESGRKLPGKYTVTITLKGNYKGTKKIYFTITPRAVENLTASSTKTSVTLKWSKVTGADGYKVYKYNSSTKIYEAIKTVTKTSLKISKLKSGTTYKFYVLAFKKDGDTIYSEYSSFKEVTTKLSAPSKVTSKGGTTSVKLTWSKSRGADGYRIYYKSGDSWKTLVKSVKGTTYTLKNLKKSTKRIYAVRAYKKTKDGTIWSDYKDFSAATKPGKATLTVKSGSPGAATLTWKEVKGANTYRVYYKVNKGDYKLYKTYSKPTKVTLKNLKGGDTYTFKVQAGIKVTGGTVWGEAAAKSVKVAYRSPRYLKAMKSGNYLITTVFGGVETTTAMKGNNLYVKTDDYYSDEADTTMIYIGAEEKWYYISDAYKYYTVVYDYQLPEKENGKTAIQSVKSVEIPTKFKSAKDRIDGVTVFRETANYDGYSESYYFDGTTLVRIDIDYGSLVVNQSVKKFTTDVPDSLFKLPKGYQYVEAEI